jgi:hypothetical protein
VQRVPWMQTTLFHIGAADFPVHQLLQHAGSTLGSLALIGSYVRGSAVSRGERRKRTIDCATGHAILSSSAQSRSP